MLCANTQAFHQTFLLSFSLGFSTTPQLLLNQKDCQIWGQTFLLFTILSDALLLLSSSLGSILHLGDVSPIVQQEVIIHILQLVHGLNVLQPAARKASTLHPACSTAVVRALKEAQRITLPLHVSGIQGPYSICQGLVRVSRDLLVLIGLHLLKQPCQVLLADLQLGPLIGEQRLPVNCTTAACHTPALPSQTGAATILGYLSYKNHRQNLHPQPDVTHRFRVGDGLTAKK